MKINAPRKSSIMQVPVIPLIDILFVLLIFFVVATTFKTPRPVLPIDLPKVEEVATVQATEQRSVLTVSPGGEVTLEGLKVPEGLLESYLTAFVKKNPERKLELEADKNLPLGKLLEVWDALTKAGIEVKDVPARILAPDSPKQ